MASFDFIDCAGKGYRFFTAHLNLIARMAVFPLSVKISVFWLITALGIEENLLRQGLFLLPSYFAEGWLLALIIPLAAYGVSRDNEITIHKNILLATVASYVLIKVLLALYSSLIFNLATAQNMQGDEPAGFGMMYISLALLVFSVWAFRLVWLYIPIALGYEISLFMQKIKGFRSSFSMIGAWIICYMPPAICLIIITVFLSNILPAAENGEDGISAYVLVMAQAVVETAATIIATIAMVFGIQSLYKGEKTP